MPGKAKDVLGKIMDKRPYLSIVAPAYNEEMIIEEVIDEWEKFIKKDKINAEIVICNDGSKDRTKEILTSLQKRYANLIICENDPNRGYGYALYNAIKHTNGDLVMTLDSDGQFDIKEFNPLHKKLIEGKYDLVTGYRYRKRDSFVRVIADRGFNLLMRIIFGLKFKDTNCAQKLYLAKILKSITIEARGYPAPTEVIVKAVEKGAKIGEVGVMHYSRKKGVTKIKLLQTSIDVFKFLIYLRFKLHAYRRKIINTF